MWAILLHSFLNCLGTSGFLFSAENKRFYNILQNHYKSTILGLKVYYLTSETLKQTWPQHSIMDFYNLLPPQVILDNYTKNGLLCGCAMIFAKAKLTREDGHHLWQWHHPCLKFLCHLVHWWHLLVQSIIPTCFFTTANKYIMKIHIAECSPTI